MRPSRSSAISASWICPRSWVVAKKCSRRSSIHLTGRFEPDRHPGQQHFLGIEHHDLRAEAAADERRDHPHLALAQAQHAGQAVADEHRRLRGVPHRQLVGAASHCATTPRVSIGEDAPRS